LSIERSPELPAADRNSGHVYFILRGMCPAVAVVIDGAAWSGSDADYQQALIVILCVRGGQSLVDFLRDRGQGLSPVFQQQGFELLEPKLDTIFLLRL
jgi:hypothetical protein